MPQDGLREGIYEQLISQAIREKLKALPAGKYLIKDDERLDKEEASQVLSRYLSNLIQYGLEEFKGENRLQEQIDFCNKMLDFIENELDLGLEGDKILDEGRILSAVLSKMNKTDEQLKSEIKKKLPFTGFTFSSLFTGSNSDISINSEIERDILSADRIYWIVSFIRWSGIRIFTEALEEFTARNDTEFYIITTTYMAASDPRALEFLSQLPNTYIRVSYHTKMERLHTKSYIFERNSGFDSAYVGSSNMSRSALTTGVEWNIRVTSQENPHIIEKAKATFEHYWNNHNFEDFEDGGLTKFEKALAAERQTGYQKPETYFSINIQPFQKEILDKLTTERAYHHRYRNLVVAATGTGKTVIAAFDYKNVARGEGKMPNILFIAHRKEILEQARATFRAVLGPDYRNFGHLWMGGHKPNDGDLSHLFISVQTLNAQKSFFQERIATGYYDYIVIDEAHHCQANTYRNIFELFRPKILLGLTATPERMDDKSLLPDFCDTIAAEIRLPDALDLKLLCPFQYFCITDDSVDLRYVNWKNGGYDVVDLTSKLKNDQRVGLIVDSLRFYLADPSQVQALCFCSTREHAVFMSEALNKNGFGATYLVSGGNQESEKQRQEIRQKLANGSINYVCVVDIFNEGVDIPEIDTVLFLRPTESLTVFLQQLGRGLRISGGKDYLTVLDFVSQAHAQYNFADKFRALVGKTEKNIAEEIKNGFPNLPVGCSLKMEKQARQYILNNIRNTIFNKPRLIREIENFSERTSQPLTLFNFLKYHNLDIRTIYARMCWTDLKVAAGIGEPQEDNSYKTIASALRRLVHIDSPAYLQFIQSLVNNQFEINTRDPYQYKFALMFYYDIWQREIGYHGFASIQEGIKRIAEYPELVKEIREIAHWLEENLSHTTQNIEIGIPNVLQLHAQYTRDEILAAFEKSMPEKRFPSQEGVIALPEYNAELLFVTLNKSDKDFSPTTQYEDYAINEKYFHWQSQNRVSPETPTGVSYIQQNEQGKKILLFVRSHKKDSFGFTEPYHFLGPVKYVNHKGAKPMSIKWELENEMPPYLWKSAAKMAVG